MAKKEEEIVVEEKKTKTAIVNIHTLNIRKAPDKNAPIIGLLHKGDKVEVIKKDKVWTELKDGFVMTQFIDA